MCVCVSVGGCAFTIDRVHSHDGGVGLAQSELLTCRRSLLRAIKQHAPPLAVLNVLEPCDLCERPLLLSARDMHIRSHILLLATYSPPTCTTAPPHLGDHPH